METEVAEPPRPATENGVEPGKEVTNGGLNGAQHGDSTAEQEEPMAVKPVKEASVLAEVSDKDSMEVETPEESQSNKDPPTKAPEPMETDSPSQESEQDAAQAPATQPDDSNEHPGLEEPDRKVEGVAPEANSNPPAEDVAVDQLEAVPTSEKSSEITESAPQPVDTQEPEKLSQHDSPDEPHDVSNKSEEKSAGEGDTVKAGAFEETKDEVKEAEEPVSTAQEEAAEDKKKVEKADDPFDAMVSGDKPKEGAKQEGESEKTSEIGSSDKKSEDELSEKKQDGDPEKAPEVASSEKKPEDEPSEKRAEVESEMGSSDKKTEDEPSEKKAEVESEMGSSDKKAEDEPSEKKSEVESEVGSSDKKTEVKPEQTEQKPESESSGQKSDGQSADAPITLGDEEKKEDEVVTVEDNGEPLAKEDDWMKNVLSDTEYYSTLPSDEIEWFKEHGQSPENVLDKNLQCTACFKQVTTNLGTQTGIYRHPLLGVGICRRCKFFYKDGEGWEKDDEGCDVFCRWCAEGGELLLCDKCPSAFCKRCLQRNLGRKKIAEITSADEWKCLKCDPTQLYPIKATYYAIHLLVQSGKIKVVEERKGDATPKKKKDPKPPVTEEQIASLLKSPKNFVDENISEAFKTLGVYQKCLEQERDRWIQSDCDMSVQTATTVARALRKIYAITKQNMDLLDKAIVQSYVENFPKESTRIHMGKVGINVKAGGLVGKPTKRAPSSPAKTAPKRKVLPKKKPSAGPASKKKSAASSSRSRKTQEVVRPSLSKKKKPGMGPKSVMKGKGKVSNKLFTKKKAVRTYSSDSDIEVLSSDDEPPARGKKRGYSGGGSPATKKKRPGPKSRTMY